jgi:hypothetical protein
MGQPDGPPGEHGAGQHRTRRPRNTRHRSHSHADQCSASGAAKDHNAACHTRPRHTHYSSDPRKAPWRHPNRRPPRPPHSCHPTPPLADRDRHNTVSKPARPRPQRYTGRLESSPGGSYKGAGSRRSCRASMSLFSRGSSICLVAENRSPPGGYVTSRRGGGGIRRGRRILRMLAWVGATSRRAYQPSSRGFSARSRFPLWKTAGPERSPHSYPCWIGLVVSQRPRLSAVARRIRRTGPHGARHGRRRQPSRSTSLGPEDARDSQRQGRPSRTRIGEPADNPDDLSENCHQDTDSLVIGGDV